MFVVVVLLQNNFGANKTPPWWYCLMDKYLPVFLSIEDTINPDQITNSVCWNVAPNWQGTRTMLYYSLQTLIIVLLSSPLVNKLPSVIAKYVTFWLLSPERLLSVFCTPISIFSCIVESLGLVSMLKVRLFGHNSSMKTNASWTSPNSRWVYLGPTGFCQFWAQGTAGHLPILKGSKHDLSFICCTKFPRPATASMVLNVARFFVLLQNRLNSISRNPSLLWNLCLGETLLIQYHYLVSRHSFLSQVIHHFPCLLHICFS